MNPIDALIDAAILIGYVVAVAAAFVHDGERRKYDEYIQRRLAYSRKRMENIRNLTE